MSTVPPGESRAQYSSTSSGVAQETANEIVGVNVKYGPALIAMKCWPISSNETTSESPPGSRGGWSRS